jgi:hypothetical protein
VESITNTLVGKIALALISEDEPTQAGLLALPAISSRALQLMTLPGGCLARVARNTSHATADAVDNISIVMVVPSTTS